MKTTKNVYLQRAECWRGCKWDEGTSFNCAHTGLCGEQFAFNRCCSGSAVESGHSGWVLLA